MAASSLWPVQPQAGAVQLDTPEGLNTFPGQSGGPAVDSDSYRVIGILTEGSEQGRFSRILPIPLIVQVWPELPIPPKPDLWPTCAEPECIGVKVTGYDRCLAHVAKADRANILSQLGPGANVDGRGIVFTESCSAIFLKLSRIQ